MTDPARQARLARSPQWRGGRFRNPWLRVDGPWLRALPQFLFGGSAHRKPDAPVPIVPRVAADYDAPPASGLRVTWLGHSTLLLEIDGRRVLVDPMWGERAGPALVGPRRFHAPPLPLAELPAVDVVLLSHDHYDHLHLDTMRALAARGARFVTALGVGDQLAACGARDVTELDWWESTTSVAGLTITATPARHFSGRNPLAPDRTLWAGFAIAGPRHRVWYSGDTAMHDRFGEIGARLGPFDLTIVEAGAYDALWPDVHLGPEQAVRAHVQAGGAVMLPVHWGTFDLALHGWTEPAERVLAAAAEAGARVMVPRPGELAEPATFVGGRWWPQLPWRTAREAPVVSTGMEGLGDPTR